MKTGHNIHRKIRAEISEFLRTSPGKHNFVLAVSGGTDSQCLISAFVRVFRQIDTDSTVEAVGIDHGFRPEAQSELDLSAELCEKVGIQFTRISIHVEKKGQDSIQSAARDARYAALRGHRPGSIIVTAHHFDDRAETVLIRMMRGDGVGAMGVMPTVSGDIFRPMLRVERDEILSYLQRGNIKFATDPSNAKTEKYLRSFVRHELLPLLKTRSPQIVKKLNTIADDLLWSAE